MRRSSHLSKPGRCAAVLAGLLGLAAQPLAAAAEGTVDDRAALMTPDQRARVGEHHGYLLQDYDIDYRVVTAKDPSPSPSDQKPWQRFMIRRPASISSLPA